MCVVGKEFVVCVLFVGWLVVCVVFVELVLC